MKAVRRKQPVSEQSIQELFGKMRSLYRLDQVGGNLGEKAELGPLPAASVVLLATLGLCWIGIGVYSATEWYKKKNRQDRK